MISSECNVDNTVGRPKISRGVDNSEQKETNLKSNKNTEPNDVVLVVMEVVVVVVVVAVDVAFSREKERMADIK